MFSGLLILKKVALHIGIVMAIEQFREKYAEVWGREELKGIKFVAGEKAKERVVILKMSMDNRRRKMLKDG